MVITNGSKNDRRVIIYYWICGKNQLARREVWSSVASVAKMTRLLCANALVSNKQHVFVLAKLI